MDHSTMNHDHVGHDHMDHSSMNHDHAGHGHMDHTATDQMNHSSHLGHDAHSMMKMYFHMGYEEMILFKQWDTTTVLGFVLSMVGIFIAAILYEGLKYFREYLITKSYESLKYSSMRSVDKNATPENKTKIRLSMMSKDHCFQTILQLVQVVLSYSLMLIFMTYNVWLCLAVALGSAAGYFLFGWRKTSIVDITEHCH